MGGLNGDATTAPVCKSVNFFGAQNATNIVLSVCFLHNAFLLFIFFCNCCDGGCLPRRWREIGGHYFSSCAYIDAPKHRRRLHD